MRASLLRAAALTALLAGFVGCHGVAGPCLVTLPAQGTDPAAPNDIAAMLHRQETDWNRGDLDAFATGYKNSLDILFIGSRVSHGYSGMLAGYRRAYPTPARMGQLRFSELEVQPLRPTLATATGHFHLDRAPEAGGPANGFFLLVLEKEADGWKIVRDDTTALPGASR